MTRYPAVLESAPDDGYGVTFPDLPGCTSCGHNLAHAQAMAAEALAGHIGLMAADGDHLPDPSNLHAPLPDWLGDDVDTVRVLVPIDIERARRVLLHKGTKRDTGLAQGIDQTTA